MIRRHAKGDRVTSQELLQRYAAGERSFRALNLRGLSLARQDLSGIILDGADLRGADLRGTMLGGSSLRAIQAGPRKPWAFVPVVISLILWFFSILLSLTAGMFCGYLFSRDVINEVVDKVRVKWVGPVPGLIVMAIYAFALLNLLRQGSNSKTLYTLAIGGMLFAVLGAGIGMTTGAVTNHADGTAGVILLPLPGKWAICLVVAITGALVGPMAGALALARKRSVAFVLVILVAAGLAIIAFRSVDRPAPMMGALIAIIISVAASLLINHRILSGDTRFPLLRSLSNAFACMEGTNFQGRT